MKLFKYLRNKFFKETASFSEQFGSVGEKLQFTSLGENTIFVPSVSTNIGEPVLAIVEAMKDVDRWGLKSNQYHSYTSQEVKDNITGFALSYWWYGKEKSVSIYGGNEWMTEDEKKYTNEALAILHKNILAKNKQQEEEKRAKAQEKERQRVMKLYFKEEENA